MSSVELIRRLHQHRVWTNGQLLATATQLSSGRIHDSFDIGQGSLWKTLTHMFGAEYVWLQALLGNEDPVAPGDAVGKLPGNQQGEDPMTKLTELQEHWSDLDVRWESYLTTLTEAALEQGIGKVSSSTGQRSVVQCSDILLHVCTHAQYTTAQAMNMLRQLGVEPLPDPMLITLAREG